jgi:hypothetical protein
MREVLFGGKKIGGPHEERLWEGERMSVLGEDLRDPEWSAPARAKSALPGVRCRLDYRCRPDPAEILTAQLHALAVAELEIGPHLGRLAVHLGWTIDMVKYRRRLTQYKALLDDKQDAAATILGDKPPPLLASPGLTPLAAAPTPSPSGPCPSAPGLLPACPPCS